MLVQRGLEHARKLSTRRPCHGGSTRRRKSGRRRARTAHARARAAPPFVCVRGCTSRPGSPATPGGKLRRVRWVLRRGRRRSVARAATATARRSRCRRRRPRATGRARRRPADRAHEAVFEREVGAGRIGPPPPWPLTATPSPQPTMATASERGRPNGWKTSGRSRKRCRPRTSIRPGCGLRSRQCCPTRAQHGQIRCALRTPGLIRGTGSKVFRGCSVSDAPGTRASPRCGAGVRCDSLDDFDLCRSRAGQSQGRRARVAVPGYDPALRIGRRRGPGGGPRASACTPLGRRRAEGCRRPSRAQTSGNPRMFPSSTSCKQYAAPQGVTHRPSNPGRPRPWPVHRGPEVANSRGR